MHRWLQARNAIGIIFKNNNITTNTAYPAFHSNKKRVVFERVIGANLGNNKVDGKLTDLLDR